MRLDEYWRSMLASAVQPINSDDRLWGSGIENNLSNIQRGLKTEKSACIGWEDRKLCDRPLDGRACHGLLRRLGLFKFWEYDTQFRKRIVFDPDPGHRSSISAVHQALKLYAQALNLAVPTSTAPTSWRPSASATPNAPCSSSLARRS